LFEQARLKLEKGRLLTNFAYDELRSGISHASDDQPTLARTRSSELRRGEQLVALCEEGQTYDSLAFAQALEGSGSEQLAFAIGGAAGLDQRVGIGMPKRIHHWGLGGPDGVVGFVVAVAPSIEDAKHNGRNTTPFFFNS